MDARKKETAFKNLPDYEDTFAEAAKRLTGNFLKPNLRVLIQGSRIDKPALIITNSKGFRNEREFDYAVPKGTFRILFLGDSIVAGMRTTQGKIIGAILEDMLNKKTPDSESFNRYEVMISIHTDPVMSWYYCQEEGWRYHPHLILLGITLGNDIAWHDYQTTFKAIPQQDGSLLLSYEPKKENQLEKIKNRTIPLPQEAYRSKNAFEFFQEWECFIRRMLVNTKIQWFSDLGPSIAYPMPNSRRNVFAADLNTSPGLFYPPLLPAVEKIFSGFEEALSGFAENVKKNGGRMMLVLFPVRIQVSEEDRVLLSKFYSLDLSKFDFDYPNRRLIRFCEAHQILCLDLLLPFRNHYRRYGESLYFSGGDMHFNEKGQELIAMELYQFLSAVGESPVRELAP